MIFNSPGLGILGGDSPNLTDSGRQYARDLGRFILTHDECDEFVILSGTAKVHYETTLHLRLQVPVYSTPLLNELRGGDLHLVKRQDIPVSPYLLTL